MDRYQEATNNYEGYCENCEEFTRMQTEPDAEGYDCPKCGQHTVMGAENAMVCMVIEIS